MTVVALAFTASAQADLMAINGGRVNVERQTGKVVVLAVGASWLPLSSNQVEITNALARKYAGKDVVFYFVSTDSTDPKSRNFADDAALQAFVAKNKLSVPVLRDPAGTTMIRRFKVEQVPSFLVLDKTGKPGETIGGIDPKYDMTVPISKAIDRLL